MTTVDQEKGVFSKGEPLDALFRLVLEREGVREGGVTRGTRDGGWSKRRRQGVAPAYTS